MLYLEILVLLDLIDGTPRLLRFFADIFCSRGLFVISDNNSFLYSMLENTVEFFKRQNQISIFLTDITALYPYLLFYR